MQYPADLVPIIAKQRARKDRSTFHPAPPAVETTALLRVLDTAYHTSLRTEEARRLAFRLILISRDDLQSDPHHAPKADYYQNESRLLPLDHPREFTPAEIGRLAPVAEYERTAICVDPKALQIWALLDTGQNWWQFVHHEASGGRPPPNHLTLGSLAPGELIVSAGGDVIATLKDGRISQPSRAALWEGPISEFLDQAAKMLYADALAALGRPKWDPDGQDEDYPYRFYRFFIERVLFYARQRQHGGSILVIPSGIEASDTRVSDRVRIKYQCRYDSGWPLLVRALVNHVRYYELHFPLWDSKVPITKEQFRNYCMLGDEHDEIEEGLTDVARAIAAMTGVDGAVLMDYRFRVIGFGAEVLASSPSLTTVLVDPIHGGGTPVSVEAFGTRHRSAFRFCSTLEEGLAFVMSQDGGIRAVKRSGRDVLLWSDINTGSMGI